VSTTAKQVEPSMEDFDFQDSDFDSDCDSELSDWELDALDEQCLGQVVEEIRKVEIAEAKAKGEVYIRQIISMKFDDSTTTFSFA